MDSLLITGANGLLGRQLIEILHDRYKIFAVSRSEPDIQSPNIEYIPLDLSTKWTVSDLPGSVHGIIHLAQSDNFREFPEKAEDVFTVNVASTAQILDYAYKNKIQKFIYASSGGVYGGGEGAFSENSPIIPHEQLGYYLGSKLSSEILVQNYAHHMTVSILRFFFIYGPRQKRDMLLPRLVDSVKDGTPISLQGAEGLKINPIHVNDAALAVMNALDIEKSATYNIAGPKAYSLKEIGHLIGGNIDIEPVFKAAEGDAKDIVADIHAMMKDLHNPRIPLEEGIKDLI